MIFLYSIPTMRDTMCSTESPWQHAAPRIKAGALPALRLLRHQHVGPLEVAAQQAQEGLRLRLAAPLEARVRVVEHKVPAARALPPRQLQQHPGRASRLFQRLKSTAETGAAMPYAGCVTCIAAAAWHPWRACYCSGRSATSGWRRTRPRGPASCSSSRTRRRCPRCPASSPRCRPASASASHTCSAGQHILLLLGNLAEQ